MIYEFGIVVIRTKSKVIIVANTVWYLANFRLNLAIALIKAGYQVTMVAPPGDDSKKLVAAGICFIPVVMDNKGTNPVADMCLLWRLYALLSRERPAVFLGYTIK
ncbi:MAG: glycosyltransferase, partial [Nitrospinaceae bacterium]|nr:glycosyltransferase [Nitrospinaceae bacterium]